MAFSISLVASPRDTPVVMLKEMVAAGSWLWWLITEALSLLVSTLIRDDSGTRFPVRGEVMKRVLNSSGEPCSSGGTSSTTR